MNAILNRGFVSPYVNFNFATGSIEPSNSIYGNSNVPPGYFISLENIRDVDKACTFTLTLMYAPGNYDESSANMIHNLLLTSVKKPVTYGYGYITPGGGVDEQNQYYAGIFTEYSENISDGYLTYVIKGVSHSVELTSPQVSVGNVMARLRGHHSGIGGDISIGAGELANLFGSDISKERLIQPSMLAEYFVKYDETSGVKDYFVGYDTVIAHTDELVDIQSMQIQDTCPLHDLFFGKINDDGTRIPCGLVDYSNEVHDVQEVLNSGLLSQYDLQNYKWYDTIITAGISAQMQASKTTSAQYENLKNIYMGVQRKRIINYICFFDNVVPSLGSVKQGTFYFVPKENRQVTNIFYYDFGNSFIDSDVIDFSVDYSGLVAMSSVAGTESVDVNIDANGELIGSNYNIMQAEGFKKQSYTSLSGFDQTAWLSDSALAKALCYPFTATMTVIGQTECNKLTDNIYVNVSFNGILHPGFTGYYTILGIQDSLGMNGFTTTFKLVRTADNVAESRPNIIMNPTNESSRAYYNQQAINNAW